MPLPNPSTSLLIAPTRASVGNLVLPLGDGPIQVTGGYGGWGVTGRPKRKSLTEWNGVDPITQDIPFMFDGFPEDRSVEAEIKVLERLASPTGPENSPGPPPTFEVRTGPMSHKDLEYVITNITWSDAIRMPNQLRSRQAGTLTIMEYVADQFLVDISGTSGSVTAYKMHIVKKGDTLVSIARKYMPKKATAKQINAFVAKIKKLNNIRDPKALAKLVGKKPGIKIPTK